MSDPSARRAMRLALKVGRLDWRVMLGELSPQEYIDWEAFERIEPYGQEWHQASRIATAIINEIRQAVAGLGKSSDVELEPADSLVPGVAERRAREELRELEKTLDSMIGL